MRRIAAGLAWVGVTAGAGVVWGDDGPPPFAPPVVEGPAGPAPAPEPAPAAVPAPTPTPSRPGGLPPIPLESVPAGEDGDEPAAPRGESPTRPRPAPAPAPARRPPGLFGRRLPPAAGSDSGRRGGGDDVVSVEPRS